MQQRRLQILLDEARYRKVTREAKRRGRSVASVIREAIDRLPAENERRRAAVEAILAAEPMDLPADPVDLRRELDRARGHATP